MTTLRLAVGGSDAAVIAGLQGEPRPAILASYAYLNLWSKIQPRIDYRDWVMDSGAFSVDRSGATIDRRGYTETARELLATDPTLSEVFALDVIGDPVASFKNAIWMRDNGVPNVIPCYHVGEDPKHLRAMVAEFDKIALGGAVGYGKRLQWARECFRIAWPKRIHGFGFNRADEVLALPWHSVDATTWCLAPSKFGRWTYAGNGKQRAIPVRKGHNLRPEVDWFLRIERQATRKWADKLKELDR